MKINFCFKEHLKEIIQVYLNIPTWKWCSWLLNFLWNTANCPLYLHVISGQSWKTKATSYLYFFVVSVCATFPNKKEDNGVLQNFASNCNPFVSMIGSISKLLEMNLSTVWTIDLSNWNISTITWWNVCNLKDWNSFLWFRDQRTLIK